MKVLDPGHMYELAVFDNVVPASHSLTFVKREGEGYPGNVGHYLGTQMQEVLRALVERAEYVNGQIPCDETTQVINHFKSAIYLLEKRHARKHGATLAVNLPIEKMPFCEECGHIMCFCDDSQDSTR